MKTGRLDILLIEDDESDIFFLHEATQRGGAGHTIRTVNDGADAVRYLRGEGPFADRHKFPLPNVIMTDLKMPGMDGFGFLRWIRSNPECSVIPTIVYSSSQLESDVREAYRLGANAYLTKPNNLDEMIETLRTIYTFWSRCECPPAGSSS